MGSDNHYPEEAPRHPVRVDGFWIDRKPVTNRQFAEFVEATGHVTTAEIAPDAKDYPGRSSRNAAAGFAAVRADRVSGRHDRLVALVDLLFRRRLASPLWTGQQHRRAAGAPRGSRHPRDASAYAEWAGKSLPTEAQWEFAAWGGMDDHEYAWGDELEPDGRQMANVWQGEFPWQNLLVRRL